MSIRFVWLVLLLSLTLPPRAESTELADARLAGDMARAIEIDRAALAENPENWDLRVALIRDLADAGDLLDSELSRPLFEEAMRRALRLTAEHADSAESHYLLALAKGQMALFAGGKQKVRMSHEIKISIDRAIELDPGHSEAFVVRGVYYYELATLNRALRLFARILFGGLPAGTLADSRADLERAVELDPEDISAHYNLARTLLRLKETEAALRHCARCAELPVSAPLHLQDKPAAAALAGEAESAAR